MRNRAIVQYVVLFLALCGISPSLLEAQQKGERQELSRTEMVAMLHRLKDPLAPPSPYTREIFKYARFGRPDPVVLPPAIARKDVAIPTLVLTAVIYDSEDPSRSVAIVRIGDSNGDQRRVSQGDRVGDIIIDKIESKQVVLRIEALGRPQTKIVKLNN